MHDKAFNIAKNPKYDGYQWGRSLMIYNFFDKGTSSKTVKTENILNKELAEELYKPIIRKFEKRKIYSPFICNIWGAGFPDMQLVMQTYLTHNEGKSVLDERFIRNLKNKVYKYITSISKNIYLDNLDDIYSKYNNTHHNN